jgi:hypothetical protein|tara:strand:+ start:444 stop:713 length:270 start_codon:yes stop_codon:yes gene_type:complete
MFELPNSPLKQRLSPQARRDKAARDLAFAKTPARRAKKADAQRRRRAAGAKANGMDYDHKDGKFKSVAANRGNDGQGTKKEGKRNYRIR